MSTVQFWFDRMELTMDRYFKTLFPDTVRDLNARQFHSMSFLDLLELREKLEGIVDVDPQVRQETQNIGDCCTLTFFEFGLSMQKDGFHDKDQAGQLDRYSVNEKLFHLTDDILLLKEKDTDSHCPILVTIEPSDLTNQEKKSFGTEEARKNRADKRKAEQNARKAKGKAKPGLRGIRFIRDDNFNWMKLSYCNLCLKNDEMTMCLQSGGMIDSLSSFAMFLWAGWLVLFRVRIWPCTFHQHWWWSTWSQLTSFHSASAVFVYAMWFHFSHRVKFQCHFISTHQMNWFLFLLFLCKFLVKVPNCWCDILWFQVRLQNAQYICSKAIWAYEIHGKSNHDSWWHSFGLTLCEARAYQLKNSLYGTFELVDWRCLWPRWGFSYGVSLTQCKHHIWCLVAICESRLRNNF